MAQAWVTARGRGKGSTSPYLPFSHPSSSPLPPFFSYMYSSPTCPLHSILPSRLCLSFSTGKMPLKSTCGSGGVV